MSDRVKCMLGDKLKAYANSPASLYENIAYKNLLDRIRKLPKLPVGWEYDFDVSQVYNQQIKGWEVKVVARPVQKFKPF